MAESEPPKESRPGGWSFRARITRRAWNDFDTEWDGTALDFFARWRKQLRRPGRPRSDDSYEWARMFCRKETKVLEEHDCNHPDERRPNNMDISWHVATEIHANDPDRLGNDPDEFPDRVSHTVWMAVRELVPKMKHDDEVVLARAARRRRQAEYAVSDRLKRLI
jgi:hypothetical protein